MTTLLYKKEHVRIISSSFHENLCINNQIKGMANYVIWQWKNPSGHPTKQLSQMYYHVMKIP